jgi:nucleosome binding factor SPN SPT16 subunit
MSKKNIFENEFDENDEDSEEDNDYEEDEDDPDGEADDSDEGPKNDEAILDGEILDDANFCDAKPSKFNSTRPCTGLRVINCKSGRRIELSPKLLSALQDPQEISFLYTKNYLILAWADDHIFPLRGKKQNTIYSSSLVAEITKRFKLDFSSCTCLSFPHYKTNR